MTAILYANRTRSRGLFSDPSHTEGKHFLRVFDCRTGDSLFGRLSHLKTQFFRKKIVVLT